MWWYAQMQGVWVGMPWYGVPHHTVYHYHHRWVGMGGYAQMGVHCGGVGGCAMVCPPMPWCVVVWVGVSPMPCYAMVWVGVWW